MTVIWLALVLVWGAWHLAGSLGLATLTGAMVLSVWLQRSGTRVRPVVMSEPASRSSRGESTDASGLEWIHERAAESCEPVSEREIAGLAATLERSVQRPGGAARSGPEPRDLPPTPGAVGAARRK